MTDKLNERQQKFLDVLFDEAGGDLNLAKKLAGYAENTRAHDVVEGLADQIADKTKKYLALNGPKAAVSLVSILKNPTDLGNKDKLAAARDLLDRIGLKATDRVEVTTRSPLFILPSKEEDE